MAKPSRASQAKRSRELSQRDRQQEKAEQRALRKEQKASRSEHADPNYDPDLEGIVAGPQPVVTDL